MESRTVGEKHLKMTVRQGRSMPFDSIGFGMKSLLDRGIPARDAGRPGLPAGVEPLEWLRPDSAAHSRSPHQRSRNRVMPNQTVMDIDQLLDRVKSYNAEADLGDRAQSVRVFRQGCTKGNGAVRASPICNIPSRSPVC